MTSRRSFLAALAALPFAPKALRALAAPPRPWFTDCAGRASVAEGPYVAGPLVRPLDPETAPVHGLTTDTRVLFVAGREAHG